MKNRQRTQTGFSVLRLLKSKRGVAIEMAISMLIVSFAICSLIVFFTLLLTSAHAKQNAKTLEAKKIDRIAEDFAASVLRNKGTNESEYTFDKTLYECNRDDDSRPGEAYWPDLYNPGKKNSTALQSISISYCADWVLAASQSEEDKQVVWIKIFRNDKLYLFATYRVETKDSQLSGLTLKQWTYYE